MGSSEKDPLSHSHDHQLSQVEQDLPTKESVQLFKIRQLGDAGLRAIMRHLDTDKTK